jgi:hypothetical protein
LSALVRAVTFVASFAGCQLSPDASELFQDSVKVAGARAQ